MDPIANLARVPRRPPVSDILVAVGLLVWALLEAVLDRGPGPEAARIAYAAVICVPLVMRRRAPLTVVAVLCAATLVWALRATQAEGGVMPFPALLVASFSVALYARSGFLAAVGGLALLGTMVLALESDYYQGGPASVQNLSILSFLLCGIWVAGWLARRRAHQARRAVAESGELARSAVSEERARIARELHDVVAHSVSIIAVQAGAAEELVGADPERAREHMASVRRTAREAMSELRRLLDLLRVENAGYVPAPGLARLPDLVDQIRDAGVAVTVHQEGEAPHLSPGVDLVAYRIVQESLTNARKHAPGSAVEVRLRYAPSSLVIDIVNGPPTTHVNGTSARPGHGLIGMRERVQLFDGAVETGATAAGGFRVHARLPLGEAIR